MKDEAGAVFTITLPFALRPMGSWWPNGAVFPPLLAPATWTYPLPNRHATSVLGVRPVRVERHNPWAVATLRQTLARVLLRQLSGCPFCGAPFLYHSSSLLAFCGDRVNSREVGRLGIHRTNRFPKYTNINLLSKATHVRPIPSKPRLWTRRVTAFQCSG